MYFKGVLPKLTPPGALDQEHWARELIGPVQQGGPPAPLPGVEGCPGPQAHSLAPGRSCPGEKRSQPAPFPITFLSVQVLLCRT